MSLITKYNNWRDAIFLFETDAGGGADSADDSAPQLTGEIPKLEDVRAELERTRIALKEANKEAQQRRLKLEAIEKADEQRKEAEMTAVQVAEKKAKEAQDARDSLEQRYRTTTIKNAVRMAATKEGFVDAEDAVQLADLSAVEIEGDDEVIGALDAVKALAKLKPHLIATRKPGAPDINGTTGSPPPPQTTKDIAMSHLQKAYAPRSK